MTFKEIYEAVIPHWGEKVDFSDGVMIQPQKGFKNLRKEKSTEEQFYSPSLSNLWSAVEEKVGKEDSYKDLMVWTLYQVIHMHARENFLQNKTTLTTDSISRQEVEALYFKNLHEDGWEKELANYERVIE